MAHSSATALLDAVLERLDGSETIELECKLARQTLPRNLWETVSAFANSAGGWIILGVELSGRRTVIEGAASPPQTLREFYDLVRNPQKISVAVCGAYDARVESLGSNGELVIVIRVPAVARHDRPVFVNGNPCRGTFVRRHGGDYLCTKNEVDRMTREAADESADSMVLSRFGFDDLDRPTIARYLQRRQNLHPDSVWSGYDELRFLRAVRARGRDPETNADGVTVAGFLMLINLGRLTYLHPDEPTNPRQRYAAVRATELR